MRKPIQAKIAKYKIFDAIDKVIIKKGLLLNFLLRLSPLIPFNLFNYGMGCTGVKLWHYVVGGTGMIPGTIAYVYFGSAISNVSDAIAGRFEGGWLQLVILIAGSLLALVGVIFVSCVAKRAISKVLREEKERKKKEEDEKNAKTDL